MRWCLVDRVVFFQPWAKITIIKRGTFEEYRLMKCWGGPNLGPPLFLLESAFQAAAWLVQASSDFEMTLRPFEVERFDTPPGLAPGEGLLWHVTAAPMTGGLMDFTASSIRLNGAMDAAKAVTEFSRPNGTLTTSDGLLFKGVLTPLADLYRPDYQRALWRELNC
ncbi:MAG: hypothetical protein LBT47_13650 [Deltaproteobacteria bacterium]|nr:hypothetical protein [Deltaproteobacteria bacterium]